MHRDIQTKSPVLALIQRVHVARSPQSFPLTRAHVQWRELRRHLSIPPSERLITALQADTKTLREQICVAAS
jgi:hypothetical protein